MMYYHLATFYQRFYKKTSGWQIQAAFIIGVTQSMLLLDLWMTITSMLKIKYEITTSKKIIFFCIGLFLIFYNIKRYEKKYQYYKSIYGVYEGKRKNFNIFLTFFIIILSWTFVFILGLIFDKY